MEKMNKGTCKTCASCSPSYKGGVCQRTGKKVKYSATCEEWRIRR